MVAYLEVFQCGTSDNGTVYSQSQCDAQAHKQNMT